MSVRRPKVQKSLQAQAPLRLALLAAGNLAVRVVAAVDLLRIVVFLFVEIERFVSHGLLLPYSGSSMMMALRAEAAAAGECSFSAVRT
mmetsp:Transcript_58611/g.88404  ORF Transcript_58611/g.88404 Transcript_58611/m.88404 type:complete len:88 (+) Transcript_58611:129-392(+)